MKKKAKKIIKLQNKAQECVSREEAKKVLKKWNKFVKAYIVVTGSEFPHRGSRITQPCG